MSPNIINSVGPRKCNAENISRCIRVHSSCVCIRGARDEVTSVASRHYVIPDVTHELCLRRRYRSGAVIGVSLGGINENSDAPRYVSTARNDKRECTQHRRRTRNSSEHTCVGDVPTWNDSAASNCDGTGCACNSRLLHKSHALLTAIVSLRPTSRRCIIRVSQTCSTFGGWSE